MQIIPEKALNNHKIDLTYRESSSILFVMSVVFLVLSIVAGWYLYARVSAVMAIGVGGSIALLSCLTFYYFTKSLSANNWCVKISIDTIFLKVGDFRKNLTFTSVLALNLSEISSARVTKIKQITKNIRSTDESLTRIEFLTFLQLDLDKALLKEIIQVLNEEFSYALWSKSLDYPVIATDKGIMVRWSSSTSSIRPSVDRLISVLNTNNVQILPLRDESIDFTASANRACL